MGRSYIFIYSSIIISILLLFSARTITLNIFLPKLADCHIEHESKYIGLDKHLIFADCHIAHKSRKIGTDISADCRMNRNL